MKIYCNTNIVDKYTEKNIWVKCNYRQVDGWVYLFYGWLGGYCGFFIPKHVVNSVKSDPMRYLRMEPEFELSALDIPDNPEVKTTEELFHADLFGDSIFREIAGTPYWIHVYNVDLECNFYIKIGEISGINLEGVRIAVGYVDDYECADWETDYPSSQVDVIGFPLGYWLILSPYDFLTDEEIKLQLAESDRLYREFNGEE